NITASPFTSYEDYDPSACNNIVLLSQQIHSDSDIHLDATGSFKRFDPVDRDFRVAITTSSLMSSYGGSPPPTAAIPPQPLRPAPAPAPPRPAPPPPPIQNAPEAAERVLADVAASTTTIAPADDPESGEQLPPTLQRAMSCDSVCSDTSVVLGDLEEPNVTGYLCVGLEYDSDSADLVVSVLEAKDLVGPDGNTYIDTYVRVYLLPDKTSNMQTR
ncbi:rabphilin-3A-like, partial [Zootermopsis nevadensis]|uniref:rabphilin-3A-like n=1 Tax=Zootermopsis nevadensis TaxID=136037 RepID=UPI000B8E2DA0